MATNDGGPAFPCNYTMSMPGTADESAEEPISYGMTLRQFYAGQILAGLLSNPTLIKEWNTRDFTNTSLGYADLLIEASTMLAEKKRRESSDGDE